MGSRYEVAEAIFSTLPMNLTPHGAPSLTFVLLVVNCTDTDSRAVGARTVFRHDMMWEAVDCSVVDPVYV